MDKIYEYNAPVTILSHMQKYFAVNEIIESDEEVIKAGTPVTRTGLNEPVEVATSAEDVAGIVLYDVKVKDGKASIPVLVKGAVNIDKIDEDVRPDEEMQDALKDIQFFELGKGGKQ